ncbi:MAG: hypothetical protein ABSE70_09865 [Candidatus Limnocylindrales bacterium]
MAALLFKLIFAPVMLATTSLIGRRWGASVAGALAALPVSAGSIVLFISLEQGAAFGSRTALAALVGIGSLAWFSLGYAHLSRRFGWPVCLAVAYLIVVMAWVMVIPLAQAPGVAVLGFVLLTLAIASRLMPPAQASPRQTPPAWDIPARMFTGAVLVVGLTALAPVLGPQLSGLLAAVPMLFSVLLVFTHRHEGAERARGILRGFVAGLVGTSVFLEIVADGMVPLGVGPAFALAITACLGCGAFAVRWISRSSGEPALTNLPGTAIPSANQGE